MTSRPKKRDPTPLKLRETGREGNPSESQRPKVKELNIIFQYNGHDFDAFEALGVPAGSSADSVKSAYEAALKKTDPDTHDFLKKAYRAITHK